MRRLLTPLLLLLVLPANSPAIITAVSCCDDAIWSPDGRSLAFFGNDDGGASDVYLIRRDGSGLRRLTPPGESDSAERFRRALAWLPDGKAIAFAVGTAAGAAELHVISLDGAPLRRLSLGGSAGDFDHLSWSPDGQRVAATFETYEQAGCLGCKGLESAYLAILDVRTGTLKRVFRDGRGASWSPSGRRVAFEMRGGNPVGDSDGIAVADALTGHLQYEFAGYAASPTWSPDGSTIAFELEADETRVVVIRPGGGGYRKLLVGREPHWSPDSKSIAAIGAGIRVVRRDGRGRPTVLPGGESLSWSPVGRRLVISQCYERRVIVADLSRAKPRTRRLLNRCAGTGTWSPNGRWLAFSENDGRIELHRVDRSGVRIIRPFAGA